MKQVISIADFATILNVINVKINEIERQIALNVSYRIYNKVEATKAKREMLKKNASYQSLIHAKKALEECNVEIEVPDLEVKDERN